MKISFNYEENEETHHPHILGGVQQHRSVESSRMGPRMTSVQLLDRVANGCEVTKGFEDLVV